MKKSFVPLICAFAIVLASQSLVRRSGLHGGGRLVGLSGATLSQIDPVVEQAIQQQQSAGAVVLVLHKGKIVHFKEHGWQDIKKKIPMQKDTIFRIYSMTKPITTVAAMMLWEEGKFRLDDPVTDYLPAFRPSQVYVGGVGEDAQYRPLKGEMTVLDLMRHTSGLTMEFGDSPVEEKYKEANLFGRGLALDPFCQELSRLPLQREPGLKFEYSVSINVLGRLVEIWADKPLDQFLEKSLFEPLDMKDTAFMIPHGDVQRFASTYVVDPNQGLTFVDRSDVNEVFLRRPLLISGGRGLVSTASDYARFLQMILNGGTFDGHRILKLSTIEKMTDNHIPKEALPIKQGAYEHTGFGFGLGWAVRASKDPKQPESPFNECRWGGACGTRFWFSRKDELAVVVMQQLWPPNRDLESKIKPIVYSALK